MDAFPAGTESVRGTRRELERHVTFRENHVHIQLEPYEVITAEMAQVLLLRAIELCGHHGFLRILVEGFSTVHRMDVTSVAALLKRVSLVQGLKLACCLGNGPMDAVTKEFVQLAGQQGTTVRYFTDHDKALEWLGAK